MDGVDAGTSTAAPVVAGLVAALRSGARLMATDPSPAEMKAFLMRTALPGAGQTADDMGYGAGIASLGRVQFPDLPFDRAGGRPLDLSALQLRGTDVPD